MRYITTWPKKDNPLEWEFFVSFDENDARMVAQNLRNQGHKYFTTHVLGPKVEELSKGWNDD